MGNLFRLLDRGLLKIIEHVIISFLLLFLILNLCFCLHLWLLLGFLKTLRSCALCLEVSLKLIIATFFIEERSSWRLIWYTTLKIYVCFCLETKTLCFLLDLILLILRILRNEIIWSVSKKWLSCTLDRWFIHISHLVCLLIYIFWWLWWHLGSRFWWSIGYTLWLHWWLFLAWSHIDGSSSKSIHWHSWSCSTTSSRWPSPTHSLSHANTLRWSTSFNCNTTKRIRIYLLLLLLWLWSTLILYLINNLLSIASIEWSMGSLLSMIITNFTHQHFVLLATWIGH